MLASAALGQGNSTLFVIKNSTPLPDDAIYVNVNGATLANVFGGPGAGTTPFTAGGGQVYSLHELYGSVPGAGAGGPTGSSVATISSEVALSARMQFNVGSPTGAVNGLVEMTMNQYNNGVNNNVDVSYVNSISLPLNIAVRYRADGSLVPTSPTGLQNNRVQTTSGATIFNNLTASTAITPLAARVAANYDAVGTITASKVGTMTGVAAIQSPTFSPPPSGYHTWDTLIDSGATATVASYKVPAGQPLANVLYGFSQVTPASPLPSSPFNPNISTLAGPDPAATDPNNAFLAAQDYTLTATFTSDLNPGGANTRISNLGAYGIAPGTPGVVLSGYGGTAGGATAATVGDFSVYISKDQLNSAAGIYGANPQYVVDWTGNATPSAVATTNTNSLADRVVGDLLAAINFGQVGSTTEIGAHMTATGTASDFAGSQWNTSTTTAVGALTSGEYFYLLALQSSPEHVAEWSGSGIQADSNLYNTYGDAFQSLTQSYSYAYSDRINASRALNPDLFYSPVASPLNLDDIYIEVELLPGGFTFTAVPEPSTTTLVVVIAACVGAFYARRV